ncbi:Tom7-domain-containing protein [Neocallimastix lanati (nom. inval.)]|uniref:Tom7-domain-containing protein n=1 Tax=Neocallimastix californiae TaxID=1754190 RepID=A0A1Y2EH07_9FUNG|nr:Tom7-domain-containing protein [Neocallimastix sp. JGI-2020a]ORY70849.1 Tom7-domain-containing protein [Neocallimastix californiae]|eukprot:ORY70849.1 Tom7-domain-containing protein [Neocallimastix californiae]
MNEETKEKLIKAADFGRKAIHIGFIPLIIYLGYKNSNPKPSLLRLISPLAA